HALTNAARCGRIWPGFGRRQPNREMKPMKNSYLGLLLLLAGCAELPQTKHSTSADPNAEFAQITEDFLTGYLAWRPQMATSLGLHEYDGKITDFSRASLDAE